MDQIGPKLDHKGIKIVVLRGFFCRNFVCRIWAFEEIILSGKGRADEFSLRTWGVEHPHS